MRNEKWEMGNEKWEMGNGRKKRRTSERNHPYVSFVGMLSLYKTL